MTLYLSAPFLTYFAWVMTAIILCTVAAWIIGGRG
jgi:hypothetical protein